MKELIIIGSGPGGYVAAIRAAQLGIKTTIIERYNLGGVCLNWGCIPTKALLYSAEQYRNIQKSEKYGIKVNNLNFDLPTIIKNSRKISEQLSQGVNFLMQKNNIEVIKGDAKFINDKELEINNKIISGKNIIIATGACPKQIAPIEIDEKLIWSYKNALVPVELPKSLLIVGSGAIGVEFASFYNAFGSNVTIVEIANKILPLEDEEITNIAHETFIKSGIEILVNTKITSIKKLTNSIEVSFNNGETKTYDRIISAVGVMPNTNNLGLEKTAVKLDQGGFIKIDNFMKTDAENIYAIGDVTTAPLLAHKASHQGIIAAERIAGIRGICVLNKELIPSCIYSYPEIASIGYTEKQALEKGYEIKVGRFSGIANGKSIIIGNQNSLIKIIFDKKTGELLGVSMIGDKVTELVSNFSILKTIEGLDEDLIHTIFAHPTLSEMIHESVLDANGIALHK